MVTSARPPSATAIAAMVRAIYSLCRPRPTTPGAGVRPAIPTSVTLHGLLFVALASRGQDEPLAVLGKGFALPRQTILGSALHGRRPSYYGQVEKIPRRPQGVARGVGRSVADVERALAVERVPKGKLAATLAGEGTAVFELSEAQVLYAEADGWSPVSHTFEMQADGSAALSLMFERKTSSFRIGRWWPHVAGGRAKRPKRPRK